MVSLSQEAEHHDVVGRLKVLHQLLQGLLCMVQQFELLKKNVLLDFSLTVKAATLIFISGRGSAISSTKQGNSGFIYNLVKS